MQATDFLDAEDAAPAAPAGGAFAGLAPRERASDYLDAAEPPEQDTLMRANDFLDAPEPAKADVSGVAATPYEKFTQASIAAHGTRSPEEIGNSDFLKAVGSDPKGFLKSLPGSAAAVMAAPGKLAYYQAADAVSKLFNEPEYGGNIQAMEEGKDVAPVETFVNTAARTNPKLAVTAKLGQAATELAPTLGLAAAPAAVNRLLAAGFSAQMIASAPQLFNSYAEETSKPANEQDPGKLAELKSQMIQTFIFAPLAGAGATHGTDAALVDRYVPRGTGIEGGEAAPAGEQPPANGEQPAQTGEQAGETGPIGPGSMPAPGAPPPIRMPGQELLNAARRGAEAAKTSQLDVPTGKNGTIVPEAGARQATEAPQTTTQPPEQPTAVNEADTLIDASLKRGDISQGEALVMKAQVRVNAAKMPEAVNPEVKQQAPAALTEPARGETTETAAPETITGGTDLNVTQERTGSPSTASSGAIPAEEGSGPSRSAAASSPNSSPAFKVGDKLLHDGEIKTVTKPSFNPKYVVLDGKMQSVSETRPVPEPAPEIPDKILQRDFRRQAASQGDSPGLKEEDGILYSETEAAADKGKSPRGMSREEVQSAVDDLKRRLPGAPKTNVVQSVDDLPEPYRTKVKNRFAEGFVRSGWYDPKTDESWLVADHLRREDLRITAYEEMLGHPGMEPLLKPGDIATLYEAIRQHKPEAFAKIWRDYQLGKMDPAARVRKLVSEYVAKEAPRLQETDSLWGRVRDVLLGALKRLGLLPGRLGGSALDARMRALARKAADQLSAKPSEGDNPGRSIRLPEESDELRFSQEKDNGTGAEKQGGNGFGLPPAAWNKLVDAVVAAKRGGREIAGAIEEFKQEHPEAQFDQAGARAHFEKTLAGNLRYESPEDAGLTPAEQLKARRAEIDRRLADIYPEAAKAQKKFSRLSPELRSERFQLNAERRDLTKKLLQDPAYVRELILADESKGAEYQAAKAAGDTARSREIAEEALPGAGDVKAELDRVAPELHDQVRKQLEGEGLIQKLEGKPLGRTLGDFNRWLDQHQSDSPKAPLSERFNLARRLADKWSAARDKADIFRNRVAAAWRAGLDYLKNPPVDSDTMQLRKAHQFERQWTGIEIAHWAEKIRRDIPDLVRRQAVHVWSSWEERGLSQGEREMQADSVPEKFQKVFKAALNLRPGEKETGREILADYDQKLSDGQLLGLFERGGRESYEGPLQWLKEPKADQQYDPEKKQFAKTQTPRNPAAKLDPRSPSFTLPREHELYEGIMAGGVPEMDVARLLPRYNADFHGAVSDKGFVLGLKDAKAKDGKPVVSIGGMTEVVPRGEPGEKSFFVDSSRRGKDAITADQRPYIPMNHWALKGWKFSSVDEAGNPILVKGDFWVHPDEAGWLNNVLGKSALRDPGPGVGNWRAITRGLLAVSAELKAAKFAGTTMHAATISKAAISHEIASVFQGRVFNPFRKVDFDLTRNEDLRDAVYHGLELGFGNAQQYYMEGLSSHGGVYRHVPGLAEFFEKTGDWTFKKVIPTVQANLYRDGLEANLKRYRPKGWSDAQIKTLTASQVNADVGMQNWRLLGSNPTMMDVGRSIFVAPQFLLSEAKVVGQAFKAGGARQRNMLLTTAAASYVLARVVNQWLNGDPHWEAKNALNVIYHGRAYGTKTIVTDLWSLIQDVANVGSQRPGNNTFPFAAGRLGPAVKVPYEALSGTDLRTGRRIDTYFSRGIPRAAEIALRDTAQWLTPAFIEGALPGHKGQDTTFTGAIGMGSLGITSHRYSPTDQIYELAARFNRTGDAKAQRYQDQSDFNPRNAPVYRKLDDLLAGHDLAAAKKEYDALVAGGQATKSISQHYQVLNRNGKVTHTFTGNAARESAFYDSLTPGQQKLYDQALQERQERADDFDGMRAGGQ